MAVISAKCKLVYYPVPKVACTTCKTAFWTLEDKSIKDRLGQTLRKKKGIHHNPAYKTEPFDREQAIPRGYETVALIRDPVKRLRSAWSNKVNEKSFRRWNAALLTAEAGIPTEPDFSTFLRHFDTYAMISRAARVHTRPHWLYLGRDFSKIDHLFKIENSAQFFELLSDRSGAKVTPSHENTAAVDQRDDSITAANVVQLRDITAKDYELMQGAYDFDEAIASLKHR
ncbi:MAG: sulfotransferase family 2 domain-containing protein [Marinosulfonomonas sp.]